MNSLGTRTRTRWAGAWLVLVAALALTVAVAAPSSAGTQVDRYEGLVGWLFDNSQRADGVSEMERDLLAVANGRLADGFCADGDPDATRVLMRDKDGVLNFHERNTRATIEMYDGGGLDFFEWVFTEYCPAWWEGDPIEPIATGVGHLGTRVTIDESGLPATWILDVSTVIRGTVVTDDGERWAVRLAEEFTVTETYADEQGPPMSVDFVSHFFGIDVLNRA